MILKYLENILDLLAANFVSKWQHQIFTGSPVETISIGSGADVRG